MSTESTKDKGDAGKVMSCIFCNGLGHFTVSAESVALAEKAAEFAKNDTRSLEEKIQGAVKFIMGPGGDEGTRFVTSATAARVQVPIKLRPLLVSGMLATDDVGPSILIDSEQPEGEQVVAFWHEVAHLIGIIDEEQADAIAHHLAMAEPHILRFIAHNINVPDSGHRSHEQTKDTTLAADIEDTLRRMDDNGYGAMHGQLFRRCLAALKCAPSSTDTRTALQQFAEYTSGDDLSPLERLRFFCSLAMDGQDWLDVEPFFDAVAEERSATVSKGPLTLDTDDAVYFYEQNHYYLSNFSAFRLRHAGIDFDTSEHAYHWARFNGYAPHHQEAIRAAASAHDAFRYAQDHKADQRPQWDDVKLNVMKEILRAKARQHEYVRRKLLETGERTLIENSWRDPYWGWGENRDGLNRLGKLWMEVRAELRATVDRGTDG